MPYGNSNVVQRLLANALTSATPDTLDQLGNLLNVGSTLDTNLVNEVLINEFLRDADQTFDAAISQLYGTPLKKVADFELTLATDLSEYADGKLISLSSDASLLGPGDRLVMTDGVQKEEIEVQSVNGSTVQVLGGVLGLFQSGITRVIRVDYPPPVKYVCSRMAAANIYDKFFAAQADKNESKYGQFFRKLATIQLNNILAGATILHGQRRIGNLTVNPYLRKRYDLPGENNGFKMDDPGRS